jgi:hypothetical protein
MNLYTKEQVLQAVIDELRLVNTALKIGGSLQLTDKDFEYIGTIDLALREPEKQSYFNAMYDEQYLGIGA